MSRGGQNLIDLTGKIFGKLVVIKRGKDRIYKDGKKHVTWMCLCNCGKEREILGCSLKGGRQNSCGCIQRELLSKRTWKGFEEISGVYWSSLKNDSKRRDHNWEITQKYAWEIFLKQNRLCALTKMPIHFERSYKVNIKKQTASLDRIDSNLGYVVGNIQWLHKDVNILKWDWSIKKLYQLCEMVVVNKEFYLSQTKQKQ